MGKGLVATATTTIHAPRARVWGALVDPEQIKQYMFGTNVVSEWRVGSPIVWRGEWKGRPYEDRGEVLRIDRGERLEYSHWSPRETDGASTADDATGRHNVTIELTGEGDRTRVLLSQDNNATEDARTHSEQNWNAMLAALKKHLES
jgi:VCBS repeat-containing protein